MISVYAIFFSVILFPFLLPKSRVFVASDSDTESTAKNSNQVQTANSGTINAASNIPVKRPILWKTVHASQSPKSEPTWNGSFPEADGVLSPVEYFRTFFDDSILEHIVEQSNLFSMQCNINKPLQLTTDELEQFLGTVLYMSVYHLPRTRMYWAAASRLGHVADVMSRDRWSEIKRNLHFNDNDNMPRPDDQDRDRLFKIRPIIDSLLPKFQSIPQSQKLSVDEQMVPFKGQSALKQYLPNKPNKWGYKIFILCDTKGLVHNFEIYTGKISPVAGCPDIGASGNIVLQLAQVVERDQNNILYFDNWFSSLKLLAALMEKGIYSLGTFRSNRLPGCTLSSDTNLKKMGRGSFEEKEGTVEGVDIRVVKWYDNRGVILASTFASALPITRVKRWDRAKREHVEVPCPSIVIAYNQFMGGVDLLDALVSYYRIFIKSRKYYHRLFFHMVDLVIVTCWLLYRRDCDSLEIPPRKQNDLLEFKSRIAEGLCKQGKDMARKKRGRPSGSMEAALQMKKRRGPAKPVPDQSTRTDGVGHWPSVTDARQRCKKPNCKGQTVFICTKCNLHLCLNKNSNCFREFHE